MDFLIVDLNIKLDGHRYGFMDKILNYAGQYKPQHRFNFLTNYSDEFSLFGDFENIRTFSLTKEEQQQIDLCTGLLQKSQTEWQMIENYAHKLKVDRVILMHFDLYHLEIGKKNSRYKISGIWFTPYLRITPEHNTIKSKFKTVLLRNRKRLTLNWALRNKNLDKIFILNDEEMPGWLNKKEKRFFTLPDPYFEHQTLLGFNVREKYNIPIENKIFLLFGYIDDRKNPENIIRALNQNNRFKKVTLLIVGKFESGLQETLTQLKTGEFQLIMHDEFVSNEEMESTFAQSDVILRMNINYFGSSGIVGIAANYDKPVIVSDTGLMADLVQKYTLGDVVDPFNIDAMAKIFEIYLNNPKKIRGEAYRASHNLKAFAETLLRP